VTADTASSLEAELIDALTREIPCDNKHCTDWGPPLPIEWEITYPDYRHNPYLICDRCFQRGILYNGFVHCGATWRHL